MVYTHKKTGAYAPVSRFPTSFHVYATLILCIPSFIILGET